MRLVLNRFGSDSSWVLCMWLSLVVFMGLVCMFLIFFYMLVRVVLVMLVCMLLWMLNWLCLWFRM